jgi:hypothetical protein
MAAQSEGGSPTHGEAARIASDLLESADLLPWAHTFRCLLEEHGEMVELLRECGCCMSPLSLRTKVNALLAKLDLED